MSEVKTKQKIKIDGGNSGPIFGNVEGIVILDAKEDTPDGPAAQTYDSHTVARLPRQGTLTTITGLIGIVTFVTGWNSLAPAVRSLSNLASGTVTMSSMTTGQIAWMYGLLIAVTALSVAIAACRRVRSQTFTPSHLSFLPAVAGITDNRGHRRLALVRLSGRCVECGGKLRFYNKVTAEHYEIVEGRRKRVVDEREPVAECSRNPKRHVSPLEITDRLG